MPDDDEPSPAKLTDSQPPNDNSNAASLSDSESDLYSDSDSDFSYDDYPSNAAQSDDVTVPYIRPGDEIPDEDNTPEINVARFTEVLDSRAVKKMQDEEDRKYVHQEDLWDFPKDKENWTEEDLQELWADAPLRSRKQGWDPARLDEDDLEMLRKEVSAGRDPPIAPFYLPYRRPFPVVPDNHYDISNPKSVVEELDRIEENLTWISFIFPDASTYEGTVWDDVAHGKGVYVAEEGLVRYEGEWFRNNMEGHGVVEVDIPDIEPIPGSKLEAEMRAEGKIISRDFMSPDDKKWLEMDIEDSIRLAGGEREIPFYENDEWVRQFGRKPEKGRYRYAGEWKHGKMHGCGVYEVNERITYGRFYFGEFLDEATDCDDNISAMHAGIAEIAATKARMFVNKPDGMVREERGPYNDPQHAYFYEDEDVWMAPGFINQFYEVPGYWKGYVHEVDQEREMWLNSFYKAPLRLPMPAELEYWWENEEDPEFVVLNKEPEPDPEDPSKLIYTEDPLILHTPTGRIINYVEDEEHGIRLFWHPHLEDGEDLDLDRVEYLPLGFDEFYGKEAAVKKDSKWLRFLTKVESVLKPALEKLDKWSEEMKKESDLNIQLLECERELVEAEMALEEAIDGMDEDMEMEMGELEDGEEAEMGLQEEEPGSELLDKDDKSVAKEKDEKEEEEGENEDDEDEDGVPPSSFGSVVQDEDSSKDDRKGNGSGKSPFSTSSLLFASSSLLSAVPCKIQDSFLGWKNRLHQKPTSPLHAEGPDGISRMATSVSFPPILAQKQTLRSKSLGNPRLPERKKLTGNMSQMRALSRILSSSSPSANPKERQELPRKQDPIWLHAAPERDSDSILSLHTRFYDTDSCINGTEVFASLQSRANFRRGCISLPASFDVRRVNSGLCITNIPNFLVYVIRDELTMLFILDRADALKYLDTFFLIHNLGKISAL